MTVAELKRRLQPVNLSQEAVRIVAKNPEVLEDYNRLQLRKGKGKDGLYLMKYSDDPYFKGNKEWAEGYANWKKSLGHSDPDKPFDVPDLFINGYTHHNLTVNVVGGNAVFQPEVPWAVEVEDKYGGKAFGLAPDSKVDYRRSFLLPELVKAIKTKAGLK